MQTTGQQRNPLSQNPQCRECLVPIDIVRGLQFVTRSPDEASSERRGEFLGEPYYDAHGDFVVVVRWASDDSVRSTELYQLGITSTREGVWWPVFTVAETRP